MPRNHQFSSILRLAFCSIAAIGLLTSLAFGQVSDDEEYVVDPFATPDDQGPPLPDNTILPGRMRLDDSNSVPPPPSTLDFEPPDGDTTIGDLLRAGDRLLMPKDGKEISTGEKKKSESKWYDKLTVRGYAQFRVNGVTHEADDSAPPNFAGDSSIDADRNFFIRRARLILSGDVNERVAVYLQADFASSVPGSPDSELYSQVRDWYGDLYITKDRVHRVRVGQSKIPYGWENLQSSSLRIPLDRADGTNSALRNERDLAVLYYYTPEWTQELFKKLIDDNLKGSGNYGMFGFGLFNGQGGSLRDRNNQVHVVSRFTYPFVFDNGQVIELGIQGYLGNYVVQGSPIAPLGVGPAATPMGTEGNGAGRGQIDRRMAASFIMYPQPWGFQAEWNVGRGPALNDAQTVVEDRSLQGGYAMLIYKRDTEEWGTFFPFARYSEFVGGHKSYRNAPYSHMRDWEVGCEWQFNKAVELTTSYLWVDRTNLTAFSSGESYRPFIGQIARAQLQINY
ncbi:porin [Planctomicrobium sp. SH668]|uniref:porin n=1 Tax=Planctomicrobium sp. SH668 TaxID=3448126 RepID=UPI003F5B5A13